MCRRRGELYWLYVHQQWLWSTAVNGPFGLKWFVQVVYRPLRGVQLLAAVVSHCGTHIRITLQNVYKSLHMSNVNVALERKPICLGNGLSLITEIRRSLWCYLGIKSHVGRFYRHKSHTSVQQPAWLPDVKSCLKT